MALKAQYDSEDDFNAIPETISRSELFAKDADGRYVLAIEGATSAEKLRAIEQSLASARKAEREWKSRHEPWAPILGDRKPEDLQATLDEVEELRARAEAAGDDSDVEERARKLAEAKLASVKTPLERQLQAAKTRATNLEAELGKAKEERVAERVAGSLRDAAMKAGVQASAIDDVLARAQVFEMLEDGSVVTRANNGFEPGLDPAMWLEEVKKTKPHWWPASKGAGAEGGDAGSKRRSGMTADEIGALSMADYKKARAEGRI